MDAIANLAKATASDRAAIAQLAATVERITAELITVNTADAGADVDWDREVKRTMKICKFCAANSKSSDAAYLCKEHFEIFHDAP